MRRFRQVGLLILLYALVDDVISICTPMGCVCHNISDGIKIDCSLSFFTEVPYAEASVQDYDDVISMDVSGNELDLGIPESISNLNKFPNLKEITFAGNNYANEFVTLPNDMFVLGLTNLEKLDLSECGIIDIVPEAFTGLPALNDLDLSRNKLMYVPEALSALVNITKLNLFGNNIAELDETSFFSLSSLRLINLTANNIADVTLDAFTAVAQSVEEISLANNSISTLPFGVFTELTHLRVLDLSWNNITSIADDLFLGTGIDILNLGHNAIVWNNSGLSFEGLEGSLTFLDISSNKASEFPISILQNLEQLRRIDAHNMTIVLIQDRAFEGLMNNIHVDLSGNKISEVEPLAMEGAPRGLHLDVSDNYISNVTSLLSLPPCWAAEITFVGNNVICDCDLYLAISSRSFQTVSAECMGDMGEPVSFQNKPENYLTEKCQSVVTMVTCSEGRTTTDVLPVSSATNIRFDIYITLLVHLLVGLQIWCRSI